MLQFFFNSSIGPYRWGSRCSEDYIQSLEALRTGGWQRPLTIKRLVYDVEWIKADGKKTRIVRTQLQDEILKLKQEQGKNILVGGVAVPSQLIELGLVDEYHFVIQPIVVGEGRRLLDDISLPEKLQLQLVQSKIFNSGCVALRYLKQ